VLARGDGSTTHFALRGGFFGDPANFGVIDTPMTIAVDDFNNDGNPDLAVPDGKSGQVFIFLGDGAGGFSILPPFASGIADSNNFSAAIAASGNFNGDSFRDLVITNNRNPHAEVFLGNGDGTFVANGEIIGLADFIHGLVVADLNGDLTDDIAVITDLSLELRLFFGDGAGGFPTELSFPVEAPFGELASADLDGDNDIDLVVLTRVLFPSTDDPTAAIFLGDGAGGFTRTDFPLVNSPDNTINHSAIAFGDFDGDGDLDIVRTRYRSEGLSFLWNDGAGGFPVQTDLALAEPAVTVEVGDFNGDAIPDLALAVFSNDFDAFFEGMRGTALLFGDGQGGFSAPLYDLTAGGFITNTNAYGAVKLADLDNDGTLDLIRSDPIADAIVVRFGVPGAGSVFPGPDGDFSVLTRNLDGSFTRRLKDGTLIEFDADGFQTAVIDRNGNTTSYAYDANDNLTTITDPVGLVTTFAYTGGLLTSVTDPASRVTSFAHDATQST